MSEATGQRTGTVILRNASRRSCLLSGYPKLAFLDARRQLLRFRISHRGDQMIPPRSQQPIALAPGGRAYFAFNKYRCDIRPRARARYLRVAVRNGSGSKVLRLPPYLILDYCPVELPSLTITVSPFLPRLSQFAKRP